jgi:hypothetical protein
MRKAFTLFVSLVFSVILFAQSTMITGTVADTLNKKNLANAVVSLIQSKDSTLYKFTRTDKQGAFRIQGVAPGKYQLLVTYPQFADYTDPIQVNAQPTQSAGKISMTLLSRLMDAVIIRSASAVRIKGDTTEFVADSFRVKEGATVEDLLKKLPGFQVNSKGEITAQGQRVQKVLVDGEEFFGDDPTAATKNLSAKAVDKVQLYDTKSDQQNLTGISSGTEGKTVNIKLKEDQKRGSFGKVEAGTDADRIIEGRLLFNRFVGRKKFSLYGTKSNVSTGSLNWEDRRRLGIDNDFEYDELNGYYFSFNTGDDFSEWSLRGLPNSYAAGGLYIDKWNQEKHGINTSYRFNRLATSNVTDRLEQNLTPDNVFSVATTTHSNGLNQQHAVNAKYEWKMDSLASLKFTSAGLHKNTTTFSGTESATAAEKTDKNTFSNNSRSYDSRRMQLDNQLQYKQMFMKKNRLLIATLRMGVTDDDQTGMFNSEVEYLSGNVRDSLVIQDQLKNNFGNSTTYGGKVSFNEPLSATWNIVTEYSFNKNSSKSSRNSFEKGAGDKYDVRNSLFSNNFELDANAHTGTLYAKYLGRKIRFAAGSGISAITLNLHNVDLLKRSSYRFVNFTPQGSFSYTIRPQSTIGINYRGTTRQPTLDQLQPIRNNEDPLNEYIGNPDLQVGFNHNMSLVYSNYKMLSGRGIWINAGINFTEHAITQASELLPSGKRTYKPVNVEGNHNWYLWSEWNKGEGEKMLNHVAGLEANGGRSVNYLNGLRNQTDFYSGSFRYGVRIQWEDHYHFHVSPKIGYNSSRSSLNKEFQNNYWNYGGTATVEVTVPGKIQIGTNAEFDLKEKVNAFAGNPNVILWQASISRSFFKKNSFKTSFIVNDILNQNRGFTRIINSDRIYQESYQRISQYFLFKLEWSFNQNGTEK